MSNVIEEIRSGSKEAVKQVYQEYAKDVYNFAKSITGSHETALEATKKTFMELFSRIQKGDNPSNLRTAALKIAYDEACNIAMPSSHYQDAPSSANEPVFGSHRPRQKSTEELYAEVEAKRAINPTFSNTPRVYDTEIPSAQGYNPELMNDNRFYSEPAPSVNVQPNPYMQQNQGNPYAQQAPDVPNNPYFVQEQNQNFIPNPNANQNPNSMRQMSPSVAASATVASHITEPNPVPDMQPYYAENINPEFGGDYGPSNFVREDIYVPKGGYDSMQIDPSQGAPDFSERFMTVNFGVVNAEVNADGDINEYDDADYRQRQIRAQRRDRQPLPPQQQQDYYYEDEYDDTGVPFQDEEEDIEEKPKKKGLFVFCIIINIVLILILIWFLVGLLINLEIIKDINLGYEWFNTHIYPLF